MPTSFLERNAYLFFREECLPLFCLLCNVLSFFKWRNSEILKFFTFYLMIYSINFYTWYEGRMFILGCNNYTKCAKLCRFPPLYYFCQHRRYIYFVAIFCSTAQDLGGRGRRGGGEGERVRGGEGGGSKEMCRMSFFLLSLYFISVLLLAGV